ncbi:MAG: hypothetical protein IT305_18990 [Chloroflexi bacterium]|nr:hypothetical protein [Chloroflexota bacterium]
MCRLLPIVSRPAQMHLTESEGRILQVAILAHDVGKEVDEFQEYLAGRRRSASHIDRERTRQVVPAVCEGLGFDDLTSDVMLVVEDCINAHHPSPASVLRGIMHGSSRWWILAQVVMAVDHLCSAADLHAARDELSRGFLRTAVQASYHQVVMRGVATTLLHQAAQEAFVSSGWTPLLCFANGTLYVADGTSSVQVPSTNDIEAQLQQEIGRLLSGRDLQGIIVGSPIASMLPKPELVDFAKVDSYLTVAGTRVRRGTFAKKKVDDRRKVVATYLDASGRSAESLTDDLLSRETARIDAAQPEMVIFKLFKALSSTAIIGKEASDEVAVSYDALFGPEAWSQLQSTSTLMPAKDMARTVDRFWHLPGHRFGMAAAQMEEVEPERRTRLLVAALSGLVAQARAKSATPSPIEALAQQMSQAFVDDLVTPTVEGDPRERAQAQVETYSRSKVTAGKHVRNAVYLCPMCSRTFDRSEGEPARADFLPNPESHTNRAVAHGPFDRIVICNGCRYERVLLQVLVGKTPAQTLVLLPHMNIGSGAGALLVQRVQEFVDATKATMTGASTSRVTLGLTGLMAGKLGDELPDTLSPEELARLMTYRVSEDTRKRHLRELVKAMREAYDDDLEQVNDLWDTTYPSWNEAATSLMNNEVRDSAARGLRQEVLKQFPALYHVGETPNLLLVPLPLAIAADEKESDANRALRELYVLLLIGLTFDVAVVATSEGESVHWTGGEGVARAPAVPAVRALIGEEWVQSENASGWVRKIGAAAQLGPACDFSKRSDLLQVLTASPPERLLARIEQAGAERVGMKHIRLIEAVKGTLAEEVVG